jgi:exocyst complex component 4
MVRLFAAPGNIDNLSDLSQHWLASRLAKMRHITSSSINSSHSESRRTAQSRRWTLITTMKPKHDSIGQPVYLPMSEETVVIFDNTLQSLRHLATNVLLTLHIDIRCEVIQMLTKAMAGPNPPNRDETPPTPAPSMEMNWHLIMTTPPTAASPTILELNNDLIAFDANISTYLGADERRFVTSGLARFIDQVFVSCTRFIGAMNQNGALRLQLDVLVLQQNLKNIIVDSDTQDGQEKQAQAQFHEIVALPRSAKFLDWFLEGPDKALKYVKDEKEAFANQATHSTPAAEAGEPFTYEELRVLIELCFSEIMKGPLGMQNREDFMAAKRSNGDALLKLSEVMWDSK